MLQSLRSDNNFKLFWEKTNKEANDLGVTNLAYHGREKLQEKV